MHNSGSEVNRSMEENNIVFIRPRLKHDYYHDNVEGLGYTIFTPYKDYSLFHRLVRELWFKLNLPKKDIWYNKRILRSDAKIYIVKDPLITSEFMNWLRDNKTNCRIIFSYSNRVSLSISPDLIRPFVDVIYSYDQDDCDTYGLALRHAVYLDYFRLKQKSANKYDVVYVGRDKGRAEYLLNLKHELEEKNLRVLFHISPSRRYLLFRKRFYRPLMSYNHYMDIIGQTTAIVNIVQKNQRSITLRDMEAVFNEIKCITNNQSIIDFELYHPSRFFVIGKDEDIITFLNTPFMHINEAQLDAYRFNTVLKSMVE